MGLVSEYRGGSELGDWSTEGRAGGRGRGGEVALVEQSVGCFPSYLWCCRRRLFKLSILCS
jgi:hypothetical protein